MLRKFIIQQIFKLINPSISLSFLITILLFFSSSVNALSKLKKLDDIEISSSVIVNAIANKTTCNNNTIGTITFSSTAVGGTVAYSWTNSNINIGLPGSGTGNISAFVAKNISNSPITASIVVTPLHTLPGGLTVSGTPYTFTITVLPSSTVDLIANKNVCNNETISGINFSSSTRGIPVIYNWINNSSTIGLPVSGTGNIPSFIAKNNGSTPITATITVTPMVTSAGQTCLGPAKIFTITVNPTIVINPIADKFFCNNVLSNTINFNSSNTGGYITYNWTNTNTAIGLASNGTGSIPAFLTKNNTSEPLTAVITVTPSFVNGSKTCVGNSISFTIKINPTVEIDNIPNQVVCNSSTVNKVTSNSTTTSGSVIYNWVNDNPSIGLASSGSGNLPSFTAINNSLRPEIATITVTPNYINGGTPCSALAKTFTITVNPRSKINSTSDQALCNNTATAAINFSSTNTGGTNSYKWINDNPSIGLPTNGTGNIASFMAVNTSNTPKTANIKVISVFSKDGRSCDGDESNFKITVYPTAHLNLVPDLFVCNNTSTGNINFNSTTLGGTISYKWTNDTPSIGLASSGTGNIRDFVVKNNTLTAVTASITITPIYNLLGKHCEGKPETFKIIVSPTAELNNIANQLICNETNTSPIVFSSTSTGGRISYSWTNDTPSIGLASSGVGDIPSFKAINNSNAYKTAKIIAVPHYENGGKICIGKASTFTLTIAPKITIDQVSNQVLCPGSPTASIYFSSPTAGGSITYNWVNDNPSIGLPVSGADNIPSFIAINDGFGVQVANITVTPTFTNGGQICNATPINFKIQVNPKAIVNPLTDLEVCNNAYSWPVDFTSLNTDGAVTYSWTNDNPSIGLEGSGTGFIPSFRGINEGRSIISANITVTPTFVAEGKSCEGEPKTFTLHVNPSPEINITSSLGFTVKEGTILDLIATGGINYLWENANYIVGGLSTNKLTIKPFENSTYTVNAIDARGCSQKQTIQIKVLKQPDVPNTFSPNGDGINDVWFLKNMDDYNDAVIQVFNRNGNKVYNSIGYKIPFDGTFKNQQLPEGVYFYRINLKDGTAQLSGSLTIIK